MPSAPSTVATDSLVLCSDETKDVSRSLVSSNVGFSSELGLPPKRGLDPAPRVWWPESKSAGVGGADSIAEEADEYEANDGGTKSSSSTPCASVSECVGGDTVSRRAGSFNEGFGETSGGSPPLGPS